MFTGIIEAIGLIVSIKNKHNQAKLLINTKDLDMSDVRIGDSIAVNGVCLTVTNLETSGFYTDVSFETLQTTTLGKIKTNNIKVNLEKALQLNRRLGGHIVSGHVDTVGVIKSVVSDGNVSVIHIDHAPEFRRYIAKKGSIAIDGVSLTINRLLDNGFELVIIPHTVAKTIIANYRIGDLVNIEVDLLARYLDNMFQVDKHKISKLSMDFLREHGFNA